MDALAALRHAVSEYQLACARGDAPALDVVSAARIRFLDACGVDPNSTNIPDEPGIAMLAAARSLVGSLSVSLPSPPILPHPIQLVPYLSPERPASTAIPFREGPVDVDSEIPALIARLLDERKSRCSRHCDPLPSNSAEYITAPPSPTESPCATRCILHDVAMSACRHLHVQRAAFTEGEPLNCVTYPCEDVAPPVLLTSRRPSFQTTPQEICFTSPGSKPLADSPVVRAAWVESPGLQSLHPHTSDQQESVRKFDTPFIPPSDFGTGVHVPTPKSEWEFRSGTTPVKHWARLPRFEVMEEAVLSSANSSNLQTQPCPPLLTVATTPFVPPVAPPEQNSDSFTGCHNHSHASLVPPHFANQAIVACEREGTSATVPAMKLKPSETTQGLKKADKALVFEPPHVLSARSRAAKLKELRESSRVQARILRDVSSLKTNREVSTQLTVSAASGHTLGSRHLIASKQSATAALDKQTFESEERHKRDLALLREQRQREIEENQRRLADAQQRARERAMKAKKALAEDAAREQREAAEKEARKWQERDRKVRRFLSRKTAAQAVAESSIRRPPATAAYSSDAKGSLRSERESQAEINSCVVGFERASSGLSETAVSTEKKEAAGCSSGVALVAGSLNSESTSGDTVEPSHPGQTCNQLLATSDSEGRHVDTPGNALVAHVLLRLGCTSANTTLDPDVLLDQLAAASTQRPTDVSCREQRSGAMATGGQMISSLLRPPPKRIMPRKLAGDPPACDASAAHEPVFGERLCMPLVQPEPGKTVLLDVATVTPEKSSATREADFNTVAESDGATPLVEAERGCSSEQALLSPWILPSDSILVPTGDSDAFDSSILFDEASRSIMLLPSDCRTDVTGLPGIITGVSCGASRHEGVNVQSSSCDASLPLYHAHGAEDRLQHTAPQSTMHPRLVPSLTTRVAPFLLCEGGSRGTAYEAKASLAGPLAVPIRPVPAIGTQQAVIPDVADITLSMLLPEDARA